MKKWEYKIKWYGNDLNSEIEEKMNKLGSEGWELAGMEFLPDTIIERRDDKMITTVTKYYFKREI